MGVPMDVFNVHNAKELGDSADPAAKPQAHTPPPLPKHEENEYLHLITYELQRIANAHEFFALVEIQEREGKSSHPSELTQLRIDDLTEKIKEARI